MKTYYLIVEYEKTLDRYEVRVSDAAGPGGTVLLEIEAESYAQAVRKVSFSARSMGKTAVCGVGPEGPYAEIE